MPIRHKAGGLLLAVVVGGLIVAGSAYAHNPEAEAACTGDAQTLCNDAIPDEKKVAACLSRNRSKLSAACRVFFTKRTPHRRHRG
jgi:hypothetical protein